MTGEARAVIRAHRDRAARATIGRFVGAQELKTCAGCGCPIDCCDPGCKTCTGRERGRNPSAARREYVRLASRNYRASVRRRQRAAA